MANRPLALRFLWGHLRGGFLPLEPGRPLVIGRQAGADLVMADEIVSRRHARLAFDGDELVLEDLGSTNGTYMNGARWTRGRVAEGDRIMVGGSIMKVVARDAVPAGGGEDRVGGVQAGAAAERRARAMEGDLEDVPLQDLLQLVATARRSGILVIERPGHEAEMEFDQGRLVRCVIDGRADLPARKSLSRLLAWTQGQFELRRAEGGGGAGASSAEPLEPLLVEGARQLDELRRLRVTLPARLRAGAGRAEGLDARDRELVALAARLGSLDQVLDGTPLSDLEAAQRIAALLGRGLLVSG